MNVVLTTQIVPFSLLVREPQENMYSPKPQCLRTKEVYSPAIYKLPEQMNMNKKQTTALVSSSLTQPSLEIFLCLNLKDFLEVYG